MADGIDGLLDAAANLHGRWVTATKADGRRLVKWVEDQELDLTHQHRDSLRKWKNGENPSVWVVDRLLTLNGRHLWELPDEVWMDGTPPKPGPKPVVDDGEKFCARCGEGFTRRDKRGRRISTQKWLERKYCCRECQWKSVRRHCPPADRRCPECGEPISRRATICHDCYQGNRKSEMRLLFGKQAA